MESGNKAKKRLIDTSEAFDKPMQKMLYGLFIRPGVEKLLGIDKLNKIYHRSNEAESEPRYFAEAVFKELGIRYHFAEADLERLRAVEGPLVLVCNHPNGGLEALFLVLLMSQIRPDFKIMANFLLQRVDAVRNHLIFVDPFDEGDAWQRNVSGLKEVLAHLKQGGLMGVFPAGEVAALDIKTQKIKEPEWNPIIARLIAKSGASVCPIYFHGQNSMLFQLAGVIHPRLRTSLLIREFVYPRVRRIHYKIGKIIPAEKIKSFDTPEALTDFLKSKTYLLAAGYTNAQSRLSLQKPLTALVRPLQGRHKEPTPQPIIEAVPTKIILDEVAALGQGHRLVYQNNMEVLAFYGHQAPALLVELGRIREITFRAVGEGTGKPLDLDSYDQYYYHLVLWNHEKQELVGAYRLGLCDEILRTHGVEGLYTASLFQYAPSFFDQVQPAIELGRSIVRQEYQRGFAPLMLLWTGIGHFLALHPQYTYLLGPVSISNAFHEAARYFMVKYLKEFHCDAKLGALVTPRNPFKPHARRLEALAEELPLHSLNDLQEIITQIEKNDLKVPILIKHYLKLSSRVLAFNVDPDFANALDALMLTPVFDIPPDTLRKYMSEAGIAHYYAHHQRSLPPEK